jgi:hypothetical protein
MNMIRKVGAENYIILVDHKKAFKSPGTFNQLL